MKIQYEDADNEIVDYQSWTLEDKTTGTAHQFRGPEPSGLAGGNFFVCLGPATTLGRYVDTPYSRLVEKALSCQAVNFGIAGAGATLYLQEENKHLIRLANRGRFAIVLVMSGRSHASSIALPPKIGDKTGPQILKTYRRIFLKDPERFSRLVEEIRTSVVRDYISLARSITVPKVLLYLAPKKVTEKDDFSRSFARAHGGFPHFVNRDSLEKISGHFDDYVECPSNRGLPQKLLNRHTGKPALDDEGNQRINNFYASPAMHEDAAKMLIPVCEKYL